MNEFECTRIIAIVVWVAGAGFTRWPQVFCVVSLPFALAPAVCSVESVPIPPVSPKTVMKLSWLLVFPFVLAIVHVTCADDLFPDKNLEAVVRQNVFEKRNKPDPLVEADVVNISTIVGKGKKIANLQGLEKCKGLALLDLENNEIADLEPIKDLKLIQSLNLGKNKIQSIAPLAGLTGIQYLVISDNQVSDLSPLSNIKSVVNLYASHNQIKDLSPLVNTPKVYSLYLDGNPLESIQPLASLKNLERLDLRNTGVSDVTPLAGLTEWRYLFISDNKITDLSPLAQAAKKDFDGQKRFAPFWRLYVGNNPLSEEAKGSQLAEIKKYGSENTVHLTYP
jgi:internalin A